MRNRTATLSFTVIVFSTNVEELLNVPDTSLQVEPLLSDFSSFQDAPVSEPKLACMTLTLVAPVTLKFMLMEPAALTRADWIPVFLSVDKLPIRALSKYQDPVPSVTLPAVYAPLLPLSNVSLTCCCEDEGYP